MSSIKNNTESVLRRSFKGVSLKMTIVFFVGLALLEIFIFFRAQTTAIEKIEQWIDLRKPQIEQALFLENSLSVSGIVDNLVAEVPDDISLDITIFNLDKKNIFGRENFPENTTYGTDSSFFKNSFTFFKSLSFGDRNQGYILAKGTLGLNQILEHSLLALAFIVILLGITSRLQTTLSEITNRRILQPLYDFLDHMNMSVASQSLTKLDLSASAATNEVLDLVSGYNALIERIKLQQTEIEHLAEQRATAIVAKQVAHDIRSPLTALDMISAVTKSLPEAERVLLRSAIQRINDIANHLVYKKPGQASVPAVSPDKVEGELISGLIANIVSEKRLQYQMISTLRIETEFVSPSSEVFAAINAVEFKRLLSNLIDNAVEASHHDAMKILVRLTSNNTHSQLTIIDNGVGIPNKILDKLGAPGFSFGKPQGSGLGLYHAKKTTDEWGGSFSIASVEGQGTQVAITLPLTMPPAWFTSQIKLRIDSTLLIVDDEQTIHHTWDKLLESKISLNNVFHFESTSSCQAFLMRRPISNPVMLVDYELAESDGLTYLV